MRFCLIKLEQLAGLQGARIKMLVLNQSVTGVMKQNRCQSDEPNLDKASAIKVGFYNDTHQTK